MVDLHSEIPGWLISNQKSMDCWFPIRILGIVNFQSQIQGWLIYTQKSRGSWFPIRNPGIVYFQSEIQGWLISNQKFREGLFTFRNLEGGVYFLQKSRDGWFFFFRNSSMVDLHKSKGSWFPIRNLRMNELHSDIWERLIKGA